MKIAYKLKNWYFLQLEFYEKYFPLPAAESEHEADDGEEEAGQEVQEPGDQQETRPELEPDLDSVTGNTIVKPKSSPKSKSQIQVPKSPKSKIQSPEERDWKCGADTTGYAR